jgi:hypothetical protein
MDTEQKNPEVTNIQYNLAQMFFLFSPQRIKVLEWGRGTGKSTILSKAFLDNVTQLPRSTGVLVAETYAQIQTRTLPSTIAGLELHGIKKDLHYFIGRKAPKEWNWPEPHEPPLKYDHCIHWWNGAVTIFISQDGGASSGRGLNVDWVIADEAARLDEEHFNTDVLLTNRGNEFRIASYPDGTWRYFKDCSKHHSITLATSTPVTAKGRWIFKYEEYAAINPQKVAFIRASAEMNRHNLGNDYFENAKNTMPDFLYKAEVENIRISQVEDGFYPLLNEDKHSYNSFNHSYYAGISAGNSPTCSGDLDLNKDQPLIVGIDWGANINCMVVCQDMGTEFRFLKNMYVKYPKIIDNLIEDEFIPYYKEHTNKLIYMWYDPSGNVSQANSRKTFAEQVAEILRKNGWNVQLMTYWKNNELHDAKYRLWINMLGEKDSALPLVRFNRSNCKELLISMSNASAKAGRDSSIRKDKSSERRKGFDQAHATHFSDAADIVVVGMFLNKIQSSGGGVHSAGVR